MHTKAGLTPFLKIMLHYNLHPQTPEGVVRSAQRFSNFLAKLFGVSRDLSSSYHEQGFLHLLTPATFQPPGSSTACIHFASAASQRDPYQSNIVCDRNLIWQFELILQTLSHLKHSRNSNPSVGYLYVLRWYFLSRIRAGYLSIITLYNDLAAFMMRSERN